MSFTADYHQPKKIIVKVNWARECVVGAMISAIFTLMASNAGAEGVAAASIPARVHDFIMIGGITMGAVCGIAAVILIMYQAVESVTHAISDAAKGINPVNQLHFVKFVKIFLP